MINKIIISFMLTFTLMLVSNVESKGQCLCPSGTTPGTVTFDYPIPPSGCQITVNFCYDIDPWGFVTFEICNFVFLNPTCLATRNIDLNILWNEAYNQIFNYVNNLPAHNYPPCSEVTPEMFNTEVYKAACWNRVDFFDRVEYWPCNLEPGLCIKEFVVCRNGEFLFYIEGETTIVDEGECDSPPNWWLPPNTGCYNNCDF